MFTQGDAAALFAVPNNLLKRDLDGDEFPTAATPFFCPPFDESPEPPQLVPSQTGFFCWPIQTSKANQHGPLEEDAAAESHPVNHGEDRFQPLTRDPPNDATTQQKPPGPELDTADADGPADWLHLASEPATQPTRRYNTWNALLAGSDKDNNSDAKPVFLSEAGPGAYDAAIAETSRKPSEDDATVVVDRSVYFSALLALAVGRESVLFRRVPVLSKLEPVLAKMRIPGHSRRVLQGLQAICLSCGKLSLTLRAYVEAAYATRPSPCSVALAGVVDKALLQIQSTTGPFAQSHDSALELQSTVRRVLAILSAFHDLVAQLPPGSPDNKILDVMFAQADVADSQGGAVRDMMQEVLRIVSGPWVEFMEEWIGLRRESGMALSLNDVGRQKYFVRVESESTVDSEGLEMEETDFRLDLESVPAFVPADVARQLFEAGRNLRFIQANHPEHALSQVDMPALNPPGMGWLFDWGSVLGREQKVVSFRSALQNAMASFVNGHPQSVQRPLETQTPSPGWLFFGADEVDVEKQMLQSMAQLSNPVPTPDPDILSSAIRRQLQPPLPENNYSVSVANQTPHWSLLPVLSFGPIVAAQASIINRESLQLLFHAHHLHHHLERLRGFFLLGDAGFCRRLSHVLFDPNVESAERKAGVALHAGATMGLRLGNRSSSNWPPASSELRLALMGLLSESHLARDPKQPPLDNMSFSVRQLPPEEVEKCLDPTSLQALDFLRLSYQPPEALVSIISPSTILKYDLVFKLLLRMLRMQFVVGQLSRTMTCRSALLRPPRKDLLLFASAANHFVTTISAYFLNTAIAVPWRHFTSSLEQLQAEAENPGTADGVSTSIPGPEHIRDNLQQVLDTITEGLFLRKRQRPVMKLLEEILDRILLFAKQIPDDDGGEMLVAFRESVHLFIAVCKGLADENRSRKSRLRRGAAAGGGEFVEGAVGELVCLLDFSSFYAKE